MKSYALAIAFSVLLAAVYSFQNPGEVTVRFLIWTRELPQGVWESAVFGAGCVLMWIVSLSAYWELRSKFKGRIKEQEKRIQKLEEERLSILRAINGKDALPRPEDGATVPSGGVTEKREGDEENGGSLSR